MKDLTALQIPFRINQRIKGSQNDVMFPWMVLSKDKQEPPDMKSTVTIFQCVAHDV